MQDCCNFLQFSLPYDLLAVRYATFLTAIDCTQIYIGILELN